MADLNPLIRLNKFQLEEKQRFLSRLYKDVERFETIKSGMLDSVEEEKQTTDSDLGNIYIVQAYLSYLGRIRAEIAQIDIEIKRLEERIELAIEEMREAFGELKKIEITRDRRLAELAQENKKREDDLFSEIALEMYRRSE